MKCQIPMITQDQVSSSDNSPGPENEIGDGAAGTTLHQLLTPLAFNHLLFKISCRHQTCPEVTAFVSFLPSG